MSFRNFGPFKISDRSVVPLVAAFLFAMLLASQNVTAQNLSAQAHASRGISLAREGKFSEAEQELRAAVRAAPAVAPYHAQLGSILGLQAKWNEALENFRKAIALAPENLEFRRETAAVEWQLGLMSSAEKNLQYALARYPGDPGATLLLGLVKERTGDYANAAQLLDSQFDLVIAQSDRTIALVHSVLQSGQREKIPRIIDSLKVRANDKQWANAIGRCTQIAANGGDLQTSEALFALIPAEDSARPVAGLQVAKLLYSRAQVSQAKELLLQLSQTGTANADLEALLGNCFEAERRPDLALQAYQRAINANPLRVDHYEDMISLLLYLHKTNDALALSKHAIQIAPTDSRTWVWKGNVSVRTNAAKDAMESYRHAAKLNSSNADAFLGVAVVHFIAGQSDAAIAQYKAGIARFPNDARFYIGCAEMLLGSPDSLKLQTQAESLLRKAVKLAPQSAEAHYQLGQLAMQQSRFKDAGAELALSLQSDPDRSKTHFALSMLYRRMGRTDDAAKEFALYEDLRRAEEGSPTSAMPPTGNQ